MPKESAVYSSSALLCQRHHKAWFTGDHLHLPGITSCDADWILAAMCKTLVSDWLADSMTKNREQNYLILDLIFVSPK